MYSDALECDGFDARLMNVAEEASELSAAVLRFINRPDRQDSKEQICREFLQLKMCMKVIEGALMIDEHIKLEETQKFQRKLNERMNYDKK
jgi:hypothetical protein